MNETARAEKIAALNDSYRKKVCSPLRDQLGFTVVCTSGLNGFLSQTTGSFDFFSSIARFDDFNGDNDPHGEHDFGTIYWQGTKTFWKIDYFDSNLQMWCDPLDPECRRVMTVMLASEY